MRVLLVEDSQRLQASLTVALQRSGYAVDAAADGEEGLWRADSEDYDAMVLDLMLPKRDGLSVLTELRRRLTGRATETPDRIEKRLTRATDEIREAHRFRYVVVNDDLDRAVREMRAVQQAERAAQKRREDWTPEDYAATEAVQRVHSRNLSAAELEKVVSS